MGGAGFNILYRSRKTVQKSAIVMSTYEWEVEASGTLQYVYADTESLEVAYNPPVTSNNLSMIWKFDEVSTNPKKYVISSHVLYGTAVKVELPSGGEDLDTYDVKNQTSSSMQFHEELDTGTNRYCYWHKDSGNDYYLTVDTTNKILQAAEDTKPDDYYLFKKTAVTPPSDATDNDPAQSNPCTIV